ncbi:monocarboxylate transporter 12-like [Patiria miniata]|uniref:Major facilitator superfamily (MFS) profile domain-containing protein n=1 Tax=Patiria miniata TaxID=46514 RepID=A0A914AT29_PATMI|nr:monocarboxylate transporter 12-like [Patiria miniata]
MSLLSAFVSFDPVSNDHGFQPGKIHRAVLLLSERKAAILFAMAAPKSSPPVDGGKVAWIAGLALWTRNFMWPGVLKGLGIMLPTIQDQLGAATWTMGWISSLITVVAGISGVFAGFLGRRFGMGFSIMICGALISLSAIATSYATSVVQLACFCILLAGTGFGVSGVLAKEAVGRTFQTNYATATGWAQTGYNIGLFSFAPLVQLFLDTYGWRGAMLLMGGILLHFSACGALMMTANIGTRNDYQQLKGGNDAAASEEARSGLASCCGEFVKKASSNLDLGLLKDLRYWSIALMICNTKFASGMIVIYFVSVAESNGLTVGEAASIVTIGGILSLVTKLIQGLLVDRGWIPAWCLMAIAIVFSTVSYCATPWLTSYWPLVTTMCLILIGDGIISSLNDVLMKQLLGVELLAGAYGWIGIKIGLLAFSLGFFPGWLYDTTGSYTIALAVIGGIQFLPIIPLLLLRYFRYI